MYPRRRCAPGPYAPGHTRPHKRWCGHPTSLPPSQAEMQPAALTDWRQHRRRSSSRPTPPRHPDPSKRRSHLPLTPKKRSRRRVSSEYMLKVGQSVLLGVKEGICMPLLPTAHRNIGPLETKRKKEDDLVLRKEQGEEGTSYELRRDDFPKRKSGHSHRAEQGSQRPAGARVPASYSMQQPRVPVFD